MKAHLFGGAFDGSEVNIENDAESISIGGNTYSDSFYMDKSGCSVYYCSKGAGRLRKGYVKKLFRDEDIF